VVTFEAPAGRRGADLAVMVQEDALELIDQRTNQVIESRPLDEVSQVIIVGSPGEDRILIDLGSARPSLSGGVIIEGQRGLDEVIVRGTPDADTFLVDRHAITVNENIVQLASVESLRIDTGAGADDVQIADRLAFRLTVDGQAGPRGPGRPATPLAGQIPPSGAQPAPPAPSSTPRGDGGLQRPGPADAAQSRQAVFGGIAAAGDAGATSSGSDLVKKVKPAGGSDMLLSDPGHLARDLAFANLELSAVL
jgi:hypothetical protein